MEKPPTPKDRKKPKLTLVEKRLVRFQFDIDGMPSHAFFFQHSLFTQTCMPFRDPGQGVHEWQRKQGRIVLKMTAGEAYDPSTEEWLRLGLPFGARARLILLHLNREALTKQSPKIDTDASLTAFIRRMLGRAPNGREMQQFKIQLANLSGALIRWVFLRDEQAQQGNLTVVSEFELWFRKKDRRRVFWPREITLSKEYYESLMEHAVPLDQRAIRALAHSPLELDIYSWLAQRLHRIKRGRPTFVPWTALKNQFGQEYGRMGNFMPKFRHALAVVLTQYRQAKVDLDEHGLTAHHSPPPVLCRQYSLKPKKRRPK